MRLNWYEQLGPVFTPADAQEAGMTQWRLSRLAPQRITHGLYSTTDDLSFHNRVRAILRVSGQHSIICGPTSLRLAGVDLPARLARDTRVWVQVPAHQSWPIRPEVRLVRSVQAVHSTLIKGIPSLDLPYCWMQLSTESSIDELVELADALTRRKSPLSTKTALGEAVSLRVGARGVTKARSALGLCVEGTDSIPETDLRLLLVRAGLPTPTVNLCIRDTLGQPLYLLDLAFEEAKVAVEYDGVYHVEDRSHMQRDASRRRALEDAGWRIITVTSADMYTDPEGIITSVRKALFVRMRERRQILVLSSESP